MSYESNPLCELNITNEEHLKIWFLLLIKTHSCVHEINQSS